ncbi:uncharacterized protein [Rutidosis leptorrhynchoides]|uniref:uncharacterized protein n=1 Tax=Rutidosis leptorrhynchoides TaxID=125765 RepID=UPI003A99BF32
MSKLDYFVVKAFWGNFNFKVASSSARGRSGGIVTIWDPCCFTSKRVISFDNVLFVEGSFNGQSATTYIINIYAPQLPHRKQVLWAYLRSFLDSNSGNFLIFGDFNAVRFPFERFGGSFCSRTAADFNTFIDGGNLIDVPLGGRDFTRANKSLSSRAILDRFLVSNEFLLAFPSLVGTILTNLWSDHCPILLRNESLDYGPIPFKVFKSWFAVEGFDKLVIDAWNDPAACSSSNPQIRLKDKFKHVKGVLKLWNKTNRNNATVARSVLTKKLEDIDAQIDSSVVASHIASDHIKVLQDITVLDSTEAANLAQKNRRLANSLGDENTSFFHMTLNRKRKKLQISGVMSNGMWVTDPSQVKGAFLDFFQTKFRAVECVSVCSPSRHTASISVEQAAFLCSLVADSEIQDAVWSCGSDKSPGPD